MSKNAKTETTFIADTLPTEFESVLGAMILCGWSYQLYTRVSPDGLVKIDIQGRASASAREAKPRTQEVNINLTHEGGGTWTYDGITTGLVRSKPDKDGMSIDMMSLEKLVDYIGRHIDPAMLVEIDTAEPKADEEAVDTETVTTEEVVEEEVIDETKAMA